MSIIGEIVARLIAAGTPSDIAAVAVTDAYVAGVVASKVGGQSADSAVEKRRAYDRERMRLRREAERTSTDSPPTSTDSPNPSLKVLSLVEDTAIKKVKLEKKESKRRGERISPDWQPTSADIDFAISKGMSLSRIDTEVHKFKNYWESKSQDAVRLDWSKTWRNWVINWSDRNPSAKADGDNQYLAGRL